MPTTRRRRVRGLMKVQLRDLVFTVPGALDFVVGWHPRLGGTYRHYLDQYLLVRDEMRALPAYDFFGCEDGERFAERLYQAALAHRRADIEQIGAQVYREWCERPQQKPTVADATEAPSTW